jgi:hypothetical protein
MKLLEKIFKPKVENKSDTRRLAVAINERPLREKLPDTLHMEEIRNAKSWLFNETPFIKPRGASDWLTEEQIGREKT